MIVSRAVTILVLLIFHANAAGDEPNPFEQFLDAAEDAAPADMSAVGEIIAQNSDTEKAISISREAAKCAGLYEALSITLAKVGQESSATYMHQTHLGHALVAGWFLAMEHNLRTGGQKTIGDFQEHVENIANTSKVRALALIEGEGFSAVEPEMQACVIVNNEVVAPVVKELRTSSILSGE